jgi:hypothetical protein
MKEPKTVAVSFRVSPKFKRCLAQAAARERRSQTNLIEHLVFSYCDANGLCKDPSSREIRNTRSHKNLKQG